MGTESIDRVVGGAIVEKHAVPNPERLVVIDERPNIQRAIAHDGDDEELVWCVVDAGGTV